MFIRWSGSTAIASIRSIPFAPCEKFLEIFIVLAPLEEGAE
jgi:hypothetical protein